MTENPLNEIICQMQKAYDLKLYYFTLMGSLSLIDTCAAINSPNGETNNKKFKKWFNKYLTDSSTNSPMISFSADECYKLRCRIFHQSIAAIDSKTTNYTVKTGKIVFTAGPGSIHRSNSMGIYYLDIHKFMKEVIDGVAKWFEEVKLEQHVNQNIMKLIQTREKPINDGIIAPIGTVYLY